MGRYVNVSIEFKQKDGNWKPLKVPKKYNKCGNPPALLDWGKAYRELAILANIYNSQKLGHYDTGFLFNFVSDKRGLPEDISKEAWSACHNDDCPGSWVTLQEILDFDWDQPGKIRAWVDFSHYEEWIRKRELCRWPSQWSYLVGGVTLVTREEMDNIIKENIGEKRGEEYEQALGKAKEKYEDYYCQIEWEPSHKEAASLLWNVFMPKMLSLGKKYGYNNVRLIINLERFQ